MATTDTAPTVEAPEAEVVSPEIPDVESPIVIGTKTHTLIETTLKKGKGKGEIRYYLKVDLAKANAFADIIESVGLENWNRTVYAEVIRQACNDATHDATDKDGNVTDADWAKKFQEQFVPGSRKSGTGVKQLREKQQALFAEIQPALMKQAKGEKLTETENHRLLQLLADFQQVNEKIETKSRKGKKVAK